MPRSTGRIAYLAGDSPKGYVDYKYQYSGQGLVENKSRQSRSQVLLGDCTTLIAGMADQSVDVLVTSPPYWGQRTSAGTGVEEDPREYLAALTRIFVACKPKMKPGGLIWINMGDAYNTPVNWRLDDRVYSSLGPTREGLDPNNSAYTKPRAKRKAFVDKDNAWLQYGNLLALPYRLVIALCDQGYLFRGEVIWRKRNPMPEGRCRRPHRQHECKRRSNNPSLKRPDNLVAPE